MDAYECLGLERRLVLPQDEPDKSFRELGSRHHPDAGGNEGDFARLREAHAILTSPARRLRHWRELSNHPVEVRGTVGRELMDLFAAIGQHLGESETIIRDRAGAKSALALAMTEGKTQHCREETERLIQAVESRIAEISGTFPAMQADSSTYTDQALRDLLFLEKWRASLRSAYARLM